MSPSPPLTYRSGLCDSHFKIQVNLDISQFEGKINKKSLGKLFEKIKAYFDDIFFTNVKKNAFCTRDIIPIALFWWGNHIVGTISTNIIPLILRVGFLRPYGNHFILWIIIKINISSGNLCWNILISFHNITLCLSIHNSKHDKKLKVFLHPISIETYNF